MPNVASVRENEQNLAIQQRLDKEAARKNAINTVIPYCGLIAVVSFFLIMTGGKFFSADNIGNLIAQGFTLMMVAVGASFVYAHGGMDFSIGPVAGVAMLACGTLLVAGCPLWLSIIVCILVCVLASCITATVTLKLGVPVFIGSMCVRTSAAGLLKFGVNSGDLLIDFQAYSFMNSVTVKAVILIIAIAVGYYLFNYTTIGKYNKALGGNVRTAQQAGVNRSKSIYVAYVLMGLCVGIAAVFAFFRAGKVTQYSGNGWEFNIMMAIILGGFPMSGGDKARISSAIIGALTVTALTNGLGLMQVDATIISGVKGLLFVAIVAIAYDRSNGKLVS